jgi:hypothetical protein
VIEVVTIWVAHLHDDWQAGPEESVRHAASDQISETVRRRRTRPGTTSFGDAAPGRLPDLR